MSVNLLVRAKENKIPQYVGLKVEHPTLEANTICKTVNCSETSYSYWNINRIQLIKQ